MSRDKREPDYPTELEAQFIMRLPEEPAKHLRNILKNDGETIKNRLSIQVDNDVRHGEVKLDHWMMHAKIVDLPTIVESLKTIDNKSFYKTADICQMMICKEEPDTPTVEEESQHKKKKDNKVEKKFLFPHGITPPTKNVRKRRFRKTLKKKSVEAPEIEKEVKRLLRADYEADSVTWEIVVDEEVQPPQVEPTIKSTPTKPEKKHKKDSARKRDLAKGAPKVESTSRVVDIFGGAVSDSDLEDNANPNVHNADIEDSRMSPYDSRLSDAGSMQGLVDLSKSDNLPIEFSSLMFDDPPQGTSKPYERHHGILSAPPAKSGGLSSEDDGDYHSRDSRENMTQRIEQARIELEELKQRKQRTQLEIVGMDNLALQQRFQDMLHTLNQDIMYKEMEYQGMITLLNSEDI